MNSWFGTSTNDLFSLKLFLCLILAEKSEK